MRRTPRAKETALPGASWDLARNHGHHTSAIIKFFPALKRQRQSGRFFVENFSVSDVRRTLR
jgi:hypothetical protein